MSAASAPRTMNPQNVPGVPPGARKSHALEGLASYLRSHRSLRVLDFGGLNQQNLDFLTGLGHKLYSEDLLAAFDSAFPPQEAQGKQVDILRLTRFLDETLTMAPRSANVALLWDTLQFLPEQAAEAVIDRLHKIVAPEGLLLAFFHPESPGKPMAPNSCRILDDRHLILRQRAARQSARGFTPRSIEKCFQSYSSVKFYLTRENLQEVLVRR